MRPLLFVFMIAAAAPARASTWVGNGGNAGDIELRVALNHVRGAAENIADAETAQGLCSCPEELRNGSLCGYVERLRPDQAAFCEKTLKDRATVLMRLVDSGRVRVGWTTGPIDVQEGEGPRASDAVADVKAGRLTLQQQRFLALTPSQRVFLLAHEHFHFLELEGRPLVDEGAVGPFEGAEGGRGLINSMSAAVAMTALSDGIIARDAAVLSRSRGSKDTFVDLSFGGLSYGKDDSDFTANTLSGTQLGLRHYWGNWGVLAGAGSFRETQTVLGTVDTEERVSLFTLGGSFKFFPFDEPMTFLGQSHLVVNAGWNLVKADYTLKESGLHEEGKASGSYFGLGCSYYIPFQYGFWGSVGVSYINGGLKYDNEGFAGRTDRERNGVTTTIGVSYGI